MTDHDPGGPVTVGCVQDVSLNRTGQLGPGGVHPSAQMFQLLDPHHRIAGVARADTGGEEFVQCRLGMFQRHGRRMVGHPLGMPMGADRVAGGRLCQALAAKPVAQHRQMVVAFTLTFATAGAGRVEDRRRTHGSSMRMGCDIEGTTRTGWGSGGCVCLWSRR